MKKSIRKNEINRLNSVVARSVAGSKPPEDLTVSEWADKKRRLSPESSAEPGPWRTSRTPYLKEPMDAFTDPMVRNIVMVAASQVGKSELEMNCIGYIIDQDPSSILYIHPTIDDAKKFSKMRISPMIRDCPSLKSKVAEIKSRDSSNTILQKTFPGGLLTMCGTNSASALASMPIRYIIGDERDRWATSAGTEGDPWELAKARQTTFYNAKSVEVSTPTVKNASAIEAAYNKGTQELWCTKCPDCGEYSNIVFKNIDYEHQCKEIRRKKYYTVKSVGWTCPHCACYHTEQEMKKQPAKWIAQNPDAINNGIRSFWLNAFASPWASWESIVLAYLEAQDDNEKLQVVYNTKFGELWEDRGELETEEGLMARREDYEAELPEGVLVLTCGVDTQNDRLEYEVRGYGHHGVTWGIKKGIIMGRPDNPEVWERLDDVIDHKYSFKDGLTLKISATFVDSGGSFTQDVYMACRDRFPKHVFAIKGRAGGSIPYTSPPTKTKIVVHGKYLGQCWLYILGVDSGKYAIMSSLKVQSADKPRYCHFPRDPKRGFDATYFSQLLSERLTYQPKKKYPWVWEKIPGHERNEALDCMNYANAAFKAIDLDLVSIENKLLELRGKKVKASQPPKRKKPAKRNTLDRFYDSW